MKIKFKFSKKTTITCLILILLMLRASYWQWNRHLEKQDYIKLLNSRLEMPVENIKSITKSGLSPEELLHRRTFVSGKYDFSNEILIDNRRYEKSAGKHVITPFKIDGTNNYILVNRGFIPMELSSIDKRKEYHKPTKQKFIGLIKNSSQRTFFMQPKDPEPNKEMHFDNWLRVDIEKISIQTGYQLLPFYLEIMNTQAHDKAIEQIVRSDSDKVDMLFLPLKADLLNKKEITSNKFPIPVFDNVVPAGRHFGYVFEWIIIAFITFCIGFLMQIKRN